MVAANLVKVGKVIMFASSADVLKFLTMNITKISQKFKVRSPMSLKMMLLTLTVGINVRVRSRDTSVGVSNFVLLGVDVGITVFEVAEFVLGLELGRGVGGGSYGNGGSGNDGGSVVDDGGGGHNGLGLDLDGFSGLEDRLSKDWGSISVRVSQTVRCGKDLGLGSSHQSGEKNLKIGKKKIEIGTDVVDDIIH